MKYWISGIIAAAAGVVLVRVMAPHFSQPYQFLVSVAGVGLALTGLVLIIYGVEKGARKSGHEKGP